MCLYVCAFFFWIYKPENKTWDNYNLSSAILHGLPSKCPVGLSMLTPLNLQIIQISIGNDIDVNLENKIEHSYSLLLSNFLS